MCKLTFSDMENVIPVKQDKKVNFKSIEERPSPTRKGVDILGHRIKPRGKSASASAWIIKHDAKKGKVPLSPKLEALKWELCEHEKGHPDDKMIVFVQFSQSAIAIGTMLEDAGKAFVYFDVSVTSQVPRYNTNHIRGE